MGLYSQAPEKCLEYFLAVLALDKWKEATGAAMVIKTVLLPGSITHN